MYSMTRLDDQSQLLFESYDELMKRLDAENKIAYVENLSIPLKLIQTDHDSGEILDNAEITLPTQRSIDSLLINFGHKKPNTKKSLPLPTNFGSRSKPLLNHMADGQDEQSSTEPVSAPVVEPVGEYPPLKQEATALPVELKQRERRVRQQKLSKSSSSLWKLLSLSAIAGLFALGGLTVVQQGQLKALQETVIKLEKAAKKSNQLGDSVDHKLNVFGRYFLTHYFNDNTSDFSQFSDLPLEAQKGQLSSIILEEVNKNSDGYHVTFVVTLTEDDKPSNKRLSFQVKQSNNHPYGFVVTTSPQLTNYPF